MTTLPLGNIPTIKRVRRAGLRARLREAGIGKVTYVKERVRLKYVVSYLKEGREKVKGFANQEEASAWRQARINAETALPDGVLPRTFAEMAEFYLQSPHGRRVGNAGLLRLHVLPVFGCLTLHEIDHTTITDFYQKICDAGYQHAHRDRIISLFRKVMEEAKRRNWLDANYRIPRARYKHDKTPARRAWDRKSARPMPSLQAINLLLAESTGFLRIVLHLCILTGMRVGEILALQWGDVDFVKKRIYVGASVSDLDRCGRKTSDQLTAPNTRAEDDPNKRHRRPPKTVSGYRYIRITPRLIKILKEVAPDGVKSTDRVVFGPGQKQMTQSAVYLHYLRLQAKLGLAREVKVRRHGKLARTFTGGFTMHALRHAAVAIMIFSGVNIEQIRRALGHSHKSVTLDTYGYLIKLRDDGQDTWPAQDGDRSEFVLPGAAAKNTDSGVSERVIGGRVHRVIDAPHQGATLVRKTIGMGTTALV